MTEQSKLISIEHVKYKYQDGAQLEFQNLYIAKGENTLLLGNSGSGKTTLLHILCGLLKPDSGKVYVNNQSLYDLSHLALDKFRGKNIGIVFQNAHLINNLTIFENLQLAQNLAGNRTDSVYILEILERLGIEDQRNKHPHRLSRGQIQRAAIGRALVNKPAILVADEPTASLDDHHTDLAMSLFFDQAQQSGSTLIVATHDQRIKHLFDKPYYIQK